MKKVALALGLTLIVLAGCGPSAQPIPPTPTSTSLPTPTPIVVTFDGNECTVSGPTELPTGEHSFLVKDLSGQGQYLYVSRLLDGKTFQDLLDLQSEPGEYVPKPSWVIWQGRRPTERIAEGEHLYTFVLNKEGEHSIELYVSSPRSLWFCAPLKVIEAPSE